MERTGPFVGLQSFARGAAGIPLLVFLLATVTAGQGVPVTDGEGVFVQQVSFAFDGTSPQPFSSTGMVEVNSAALSAATNMSSGFLNVADSAGWVVQNLPISPTIGNLSTSFNLGTTDGVNITPGGLNLSVTFSPTPLPVFTPPVSTHYSVSQANYNDQGEGARPSPLPPPGANVVQFQPGGGTTIAFQPGHPNVQAADNQCGPAAFANSLTYLKNTYGLNIPDPNVPGRGDPATGNLTVPNGPGMETAGNSLVGRLDLAMNRGSTSRTSGDTTTGAQQLTGVMNYLGSARVNDAGAVSIQYQGITGVGPTAGITPVNRGASVTTDFIISEINRGEDVKLGVTGHAVELVGAGTILGIPWIAYVSDHLQTGPLDPNDTLLNNAPFPLSLLNLPDFAFLVPMGGNLTLAGDPGTPTAFNVISISFVPEPAGLITFALGCGVVLVLGGRRWYNFGRSTREGRGTAQLR